MESQRLRKEMHSYISLICVTILAIYGPTFTTAVLSPLAVNVALNKNIIANITCGSTGPETYYDHSQVLLDPSMRTIQSCADPSVRPAAAMVDGNLSTWWQSTSRRQLYLAGYGYPNQDAIIVIDLEQRYEIDEILLQFGDSKRPKRFSIERSDDGINYIPWVIRESDQADCSSTYENLPSKVDSIICRSYGAPRETNYESIRTDLSSVPGYLAGWTMSRYLRFKFYQMDLTLGITGDKFQHYTVRNLEVHAECICNGHADACDYSNITGNFECVCGDNTQGRQCDQCLPAFNQKKFKYGATCEGCNCFNHTDACYFNQSVADLGLSLNLEGKKNGGGVCQNCDHNTTGINCEKCVDFFYRPLGRSQGAGDACIPCGCFDDGIVMNLETGRFGDCIMNDDGIMPFGKIPGDCLCKTNVAGPKCDQCKPEYFNLTMKNSNGCQDCLCNVPGTINSSNVCSGDSMGQCPCKANVINRQCNECRDQFYNLTDSNTDGCSSCDCDVGGSTSPICDKTSGQCTCRSDLTGRMCDRSVDEFYSVTAYFIAGEFETAVSDHDILHDDALNGFMGPGYISTQTGVKTSVTLLVPNVPALSSEQYRLLLRYRTAVSGFIGITATITNGSSPITFTEALPTCVGGWCTYPISGKGELSLNPGQYSVTATFTGAVYLDQIIALPEEFATPDALGSSLADQFVKDCGILTDGSMSDDAFCRKQMFSLSVIYMDGGVQCGCDAVGSLDTTCEQYGGQCHCKAGVTGRTCNVCMPGFYNLTSAGCQACDCAADNKNCLRTTGQCLCPANTEERKCDTCVVNHWNWHTTKGCEACNCNATGSVSLQCTLTYGQCSCKPGVDGYKCEQCADGYNHYSESGCMDCGCDMDGSQSSVCEKGFGQCSCKTNTEGLTCDLCKSGTFFNNEDHPNGCLDCICMGTTSNCSSTSWKHQKVDLFTEGSFFLMNGLKMFSHNVTVDPATGRTHLSANMAGASTERLFWWPMGAPFSGNLLGIYKGVVSFEVQYTAQGAGTPSYSSAALLGKNGDIFYHNVTALADDTLTTVNITMWEHDWSMEGSSRNPSRKQFLLVLQNVEMILFPATFFSGSHISKLFGASYNIAMSNSSSMVPALGVEQCQCPTAYDGLSCERCAYGFKRANVSSHDFLGVCVPCECNGHSSNCDADTGKCIACQHDTTGFNCDKCQSGFYGDASVGTPTDCTACPCYSPRVVNSTCQEVGAVVKCSYCNTGYIGDRCDGCDDFYYGNPDVAFTGQCQRCNCNGNTDRCNITNGQCISCGFNSDGFNCERCADEFFGDATTQACTGCNCNMDGSLSKVCDYASGACQCLPGVVGRVCDQCDVNHYGYNVANITGCVDCKCNAAGSASLQCDLDTGICNCHLNASGDKCGLCAFGSWGLPYQQCQSCSCDANGTNPATPCDRMFGQCNCRPGVRGRDCDECMKMHVDFSDSGCRSCDRCEFTLRSQTDQLQQNWEVYWNTSTMVAEVMVIDKEMEAMRAGLNETLEKLGVSGQSLGSILKRLDNMTQIEPRINASVSNLMSQVYLLMSNAYQLENVTLEETIRLATLRQGILDTQAQLVLTLQKASKVEGDLLQHNKSAQEILVASKKIDTQLDITLVQNLQIIVNETILSDQAVQMTGDRLQGASEQNQFLSNLDQQSHVIDDKYVLLNQSYDGVTMDLTGIETTGQDTLVVLNETMHHKEFAEHLFLEVALGLNYTDYIHRTTVGLFSDGAIAFDEAQAAEQSWMVSSATLSTSINSTSSVLAMNAVEVEKAEAWIVNLTTHADEINRLYEEVKPKGETAVEAITYYETVVALINQSLTLAMSANQTMMQAMEAIDNITLLNLELQANESKKASEELVAEVAKSLVSSADLQSQIESVNASYQDSINYWSDLDANSTMFYKEVSDLMTTSNGQGIMTALSQGSSFNELTMSVVKQIEWDYMPHQYDIDNHLSDQDLIISGVTETYNNATVVVADLNNQVTQFQNDLATTVQSKADQIEALYKETSITRLSIEARLDAIAAKLAKIESLVDKFEQPVKFFGNDSISHAAEEPTNNTVYNDLELDFQTSNGTSGLLFYTREESSNSSLSLYMQGGSLIFEFNIDGAVETVRSMVDVCDGCWFRVHANRYGNTGQLTVTRLSTGGTTSSFSSTPLDINIYLALPGPFYVGGLPNGVDPHMNRGYFEGCVYNVIFDGVQVPIWKARTLAGETACCSKPVETDTSTSTSGVTMNGFGYVELKQNDLNFAETSGVSVHFRTYDTDAVILAVDAEKTDEYYGIFLKQGQLVFEYGSDASNIYVKTSNTYNDGGWHQVVTYHNSTEAMISVLSLNDTGYHLQETVKSILVTSTAPMTSLAFANVYLGGVAPDFKASWLPVDPSFAGCLKELQHSKGSDPLLYIRNITDSLIQQIIPGLSFASDTAYAWIGLLPATTVTFNTIQFQLYTEQHDGILVYVQSATDPTMHLYVSVYGGIVFMKIGDAAPILTTDMFVSNGQQQDITIDISTSSPKLIVNGQTFTSPGTVSTGLVASSFYVGGVPNSVVLDHDLPVQASLQGGIDQLYINNNLLDFFRVSIILAQSGASLAGLPLPPDTLPLPPFTTTTSIPTSPAPSCAVTPSYGSVTEGVRFGDQDVSYLAFNLGSTSNLFTTSFVLVTEFRALDPNGLIYYAASSENDPSSWLALYLQDGYLTFSMQTDTKDFRTKGVQLSKKYDDGNWWESTVLRINDFVALIVTSRSDYKNNEVPSTQFSNLNVNTDLFIGGVTPNITGYPFNGTIPVGKLPFSGCLRKMELNSHTQPNPIIFDLSAPSYSQGTGQCYANVVPGVYFAGSGYAHISNNFTVGNSLEVDFTLKPTENTGILMTLVTSTDHYAVLQLNDGQVELLLPNASNTSSPVILSTFLLLKPHDICDGSEHTLSAHVNTSHVVIRVDGVRHVAAVPPESTAWVMTLDGGNLYLAGKPGGVTNHSAGMVTNNFSGCVTSMAVNGDVKNPREVAELTGAMIGCPSG